MDVAKEAKQPSPITQNRKALELEAPCSGCLGNGAVGALDPRCPVCKGTGYEATARGKELMRFLARGGITPRIPAVTPAGHVAPEAEVPPRVPPPKAAFKEGDTTTFRGRAVHIANASYQWDAEPKGWVYGLAGIPGLVSEAELTGGPGAAPAVDAPEPTAGGPEDK